MNWWRARQASISVSISGLFLPTSQTSSITCVNIVAIDSQGDLIYSSWRVILMTWSPFVLWCISTYHKSISRKWSYIIGISCWNWWGKKKTRRRGSRRRRRLNGVSSLSWKNRVAPLTVWQSPTWQLQGSYSMLNNEKTYREWKKQDISWQRTIIILHISFEWSLNLETFHWLCMGMYLHQWSSVMGFSL